MKWIITKLLLFLLAGAIVNVAVAWGCSLWSPHSLHGRDETHTNFMSWQFKVERGFGLERVVLTTHGYSFSKTPVPAAPDYVETDIASYDHGEQYVTTKMYLTTGWPWHSFRSKTSVLELSRSDKPPINVPDYPKVSWQSGLILKVNPPRKPLMSNNRPLRQMPHVLPSKILPLRPLLLGLLLNTIFYSVIVWLLTLGPFTARRFIRSKRGRCIKCGYDLRNVEHEKCPECGKELGEKAKQ